MAPAPSATTTAVAMAVRRLSDGSRSGILRHSDTAFSRRLTLGTASSRAGGARKSWANLGVRRAPGPWLGSRYSTSLFFLRYIWLRSTFDACRTALNEIDRTVRSVYIGGSIQGQYDRTVRSMKIERNA